MLSNLSCSVSPMATYNGAKSVPLKFSGIQLWLNAANSSSLTLSGSSLTQWNDKSGLGKNAVPFESGSGSPTYSSTGFNNLPGI